MDTSNSLTNRLHSGHYKGDHPFLKPQSLLRFRLLLVIFVGFLPFSVGQSEASGDSEMDDPVMAQAGAKIFEEKIAQNAETRTEHANRPDLISWEGISLHGAFIARMDEVAFNVMGIEVQHRFEQGLGPKPEFSYEMLPEVRVFADVMAEQGAESEIYDSLITIAGMVASEEKGELIYETAPDQWIKKPALYDRVSGGFEKILKTIKASPESTQQFEGIIQERFIPLVDKLTEESMSLGGVVRHFSDNVEFRNIENLKGKLSAFAKISFLVTVNEWAEQNQLPQLDLSKNLPEEYLVTAYVAGKVPADQLQFARETVAGISLERQDSVDKTAVTSEKADAQKEQATINSR